MASERTWHNFEMIIFALNIFCVPVVIFSESKNKRKTLHKYYNVCKLYRVTAADASVHKFWNCIKVNEKERERVRAMVIVYLDFSPTKMYVQAEHAFWVMKTHIHSHFHICSLFILCVLCSLFAYLKFMRLLWANERHV